MRTWIQGVKHWYKWSTFNMICMLWDTVSPDCRAQLVWEFLFDPRSLKERFLEEAKFQVNLRNSFKS